jgi:endonuclease YncB( thermonuclease family)
MKARLVRLFGLAVCIVGIFAALILAQRFAAVPHVAEAPSAGSSTTQTASAAASPPAAPEPPRPVRDVTPEGVARGFMPPPAAPKRKPVASIRITEAGVKPDGTIVGEGGAVRLYGVTFPEAKKVCRTASGENWPCGRRAYITLHNRIAAETVSCEPRSNAEPPAAATPAADCHVGDLNLAEWMLGQGLAQLAPGVTDENLATAEAQARKARAGLWSDPGEAAPMSAQRQ